MSSVTDTLLLDYKEQKYTTRAICQMYCHVLHITCYFSCTWALKIGTGDLTVTVKFNGQCNIAHGSELTALAHVVDISREVQPPHLHFFRKFLQCLKRRRIFHERTYIAQKEKARKTTMNHWGCPLGSAMWTWLAQELLENLISNCRTRIPSRIGRSVVPFGYNIIQHEATLSHFERTREFFEAD